MTPDIEQIRSRVLEAIKTDAPRLLKRTQMSLDFRRHIIEYETALLAAIDELTAQRDAMLVLHMSLMIRFM